MDGGKPTPPISPAWRGRSPRAWRAAVEQLGIEFRQYDLRTGQYRAIRPRFHDLRHTGAQYLYRAGVDKTTIKDLGGWKTDAMFERYRMEDELVKQQAVAKLEAYVVAERAAAAERRDVLPFPKRRR